MDGPPKFCSQSICDIIGESTDFVFRTCLDKWILLITQNGHIESIYDVEPDMPICGALQHPEFDEPVKMICNFGSDHAESKAAIQTLVRATKLQLCPKPLHIGLGLKTLNGQCLKAVAEVVDQLMIRYFQQIPKEYQ